MVAADQFAMYPFAPAPIVSRCEAASYIYVCTVRIEVSIYKLDVLPHQSAVTSMNTVYVRRNVQYGTARGLFINNCFCVSCQFGVSM